MTLCNGPTSKSLKQFFLEIVFLKAYSNVAWHFMFDVMLKLGIPEAFVHMAQLPFDGTGALANLNGQQIDIFPIQHENANKVYVDHLVVLLSASICSLDQTVLGTRV